MNNYAYRFIWETCNRPFEVLVKHNNFPDGSYSIRSVTYGEGGAPAPVIIQKSGLNASVTAPCPFCPKPVPKLVSLKTDGQGN